MDNQNPGGQIPPIEPKAPNQSPLNKGLIIGLSVAIILLLATVIYLLNSRPTGIRTLYKEDQAQGQQEQVNEVAGWKTYRNEQFGFEFKYPAEYKTETPPNYGDSLRLIYLSHPAKNAAISVYTNGEFSLNRIREEFSPTGLQDIAPKKIKADQNTFYYYGAGGGGVEYPDQYFYNLNGKLLLVLFDGPYENDKTPNQETKELAPKILATFKFSGQDETADWKTYRNVEYGFEFSYPASLMAKAGSGPTNFMKRNTGITIEDSEYFETVKRIEGSEGPAYLLSISASEPYEAYNTKDCGEYTQTGTITLDGMSAKKCEGKYFGDWPALQIIFTKGNNVFYVMKSYKYSGEDKQIVDKIISTFKFIN